MEKAKLWDNQTEISYLFSDSVRNNAKQIIYKLETCSTRSLSINVLTKEKLVLTSMLLVGGDFLLLEWVFLAF
jgi:hypothetical protein